MRNIIVTLSLVISFYSNAQDLIIKIDGEEIPAKVTEISLDFVKFKKFDLLDGPIYNVANKEIYKIIFSNGKEEIFNKPTQKKEKPKPGFFVDKRDNKGYEIITIGEQTWFAQNLSFKTVKSWCFDNNAQYCETSGRLYTYEAALEACPNGWHLPSDKEWKKLEVELGMGANVNNEGWRGTTPGQGQMLKKGGGSGFNAKFGGYCTYTYKAEPMFYNIKQVAIYWTSTRFNRNDKDAWTRQLNFRASVYRIADRRTRGFSVRCIKD